MGYATFRITDGTAENTVDFIGGPFYIVDWRQVIPGYKNNGVYIDSPISHGRRIAFFTYENSVERIDFRTRNADGDTSEQKLSKLHNLMKKAARHWTTNGRVGPVWLEYKSSRTTQTQYALIVTGQLSGKGNPFSQPYLQPDDYVVEAGMNLIIERRLWQNGPPGSPGLLTLTDDTEVINTVTNGSFEDTTEPSSTWIDRNSNVTSAFTTSYAYFGDYSIELEATGSPPGGVYQDVTGLEPGSSVTCTAYALVRQGTAKLVVYDGGGFTSAVTDTSSVGVWTQLSVTKTVPGSGSVRVSLEPDSLNDLVTFDHVQLLVTFGTSGAETTSPVHVLNTHGQHPITHVYVDDGGSFGSNLIHSSPPYNLLPASPSTGDAVYIGSSDDYQDGGPFSNVLFNIGSAADVTITWEYINSSSSWATLDFVDNTESFSNTGENFLTYSGPNLWKRGHDISADGGPSVTAYWIRGRVTAVGSAGAAQQTGEHVYTVNRPYIEIPGTTLVSDEPSQVDLTVKNVGGAIGELSSLFPSAGTDDAIWDDPTAGAGDDNNLTDFLTEDKSILVHFPNVQIPKDAIINSAQISAQSAGGAVGDVVIGVAMEDSDNSAALNDLIYEPGARSWYSYVEWSPSAFLWNLYDGFGRLGPELTSQFQNIVNKANWTSGNGMTVRLTDIDIATGDGRQFGMYETDSEAWRIWVSWVQDGVPMSTVIAGSRQTSRGADFQSVIPISPYQRNAVTVDLGESTLFLSEDSQTGNFYAWDWAAAVQPTATEETGLKDRVIVTIPSALASSFTGQFRLMCRVFNDFTLTEDTTPEYRARIRIGGGDSFTATKTSYLEKPELINFGLISVPFIEQDSDALTIEIAIQAAGPVLTGSDRFYISDIILIPADEWIAQVRAPTDATTAGLLGKDSSVVIKSINTTDDLSATMTDPLLRKVVWRASGLQFTPEENETVRVYFLAASEEISPLGGTYRGLSSRTNNLFEVSGNIQKRFTFYEV